MNLRGQFLDFIGNPEILIQILRPRHHQTRQLRLFLCQLYKRKWSLLTLFQTHHPKSTGRTPPPYLSATRPKWPHTLGFKPRPPILEPQLVPIPTPYPLADVIFGWPLWRLTIQNFWNVRIALILEKGAFQNVFGRYAIHTEQIQNHVVCETKSALQRISGALKKAQRKRDATQKNVTWKKKKTGWKKIMRKEEKTHSDVPWQCPLERRPEFARPLAASPRPVCRCRADRHARSSG